MTKNRDRDKTSAPLSVGPIAAMLISIALCSGCGSEAGGLGLPGESGSDSSSTPGGSSGGSSGGGGKPSTPGTGAGMPGSPPTIFGSWLTTQGTESALFTFRQDGTYELELLIATSTVTGDEFIEQGTYSLDGATISYAPTAETCPVAVAAASEAYSFDGAALVLTTSAGSSTFTPTDPSKFGAGMTLVVGCSTTTGGPWMPEPTTGPAPAAGPSLALPSVYGSWVATSGTATVEVTLNSNGTYEIDVLIPTSTVTGDEYIQQGTFAFDGTNLDFTPQEATCPGNVPVFVDGYLFNDANLLLAASNGTLLYSRAGSGALGAGLTLVLGCSVNNGPWMPEPLAPVGN